MAEITEDLERKICQAWNTMAKLAQEAKESYLNAAAEAMNFYAQPNHNFMFEGFPDFKVTINKVWELVSLYGPHLYAQNPTRAVTPRNR